MGKAQLDGLKVPSCTFLSDVERTPLPFLDPFFLQFNSCIGGIGSLALGYILTSRNFLSSSQLKTHMLVEAAGLVPTTFADIFWERVSQAL